MKRTNVKQSALGYLYAVNLYLVGADKAKAAASLASLIESGKARAAQIDDATAEIGLHACGVLHLAFGSQTRFMEG